MLEAFGSGKEWGSSKLNGATVRTSNLSFVARNDLLSAASKIGRC